MFSAKTYTARRHELRTKIGSGIILLPGNSLSPNNYPNNAYYFRQDSSFRYYFGLNVPSVVGVIDADTGEEALYGDDFTVEDIIWTGPQPTLREMGAGAGVTATFPMAELEKRLRRAISLGRRVHYLPPYRGETKLQLSALLGIKPALLHDYKSVDLMFAVAEMREKKSAEEVEEMERAFRIGYEMHTTAMRMCRPGVVERQIAGAIEGVAKSQGQGVSFPSIVSQHGETLHNLNADMAEEKAAELDNKVKVGSVLRARDIRLSALNDRSKPVSRVKNAARLRVDFVLAANELATPGNKAVYVRITSPDGYVLTTEAMPTFEFEGERLSYSAMREVDYQNQDLEVGIYYNSTGFAAGTYQIQLYCEGRLIGQTQVVMK